MLRRNVLSLATVLVFTSGVAVAQDATTPPPAAPPAAEAPPPEAPPASDVVVGDAPAAAPAAGDQEQTEEIVVTGTRIRRKDLTTPAPVTVINREQIAASGKVSIGDFLQALPEQGNAINTSVNNGGDGATRVNLRGVGSPRTLVLVNGRRWMPGGVGADDSVDLNSIPTAAVERVEVLKDGASAVYGSDAIAGVVNIITRRGGDQTDLSAFSGTSYKRDGTTYDLNFTTGTGGERGSLLFSAGYYTQKKTMADARSFSAVPYFFDAAAGPYTAGSGTIPAGRTLESLPAGAGAGNQLFTDLAAAGDGPGSFIWVPDTTPDPANGIFCGTSNGAPVCFREFAGTGLPEAGEAGDGYNFQPDNYLVTPQERIQLFATGDLNLTSWARGFFEAAYVNRQSAQDLAPEPLVLDTEGVAVSADNIYNPFGTDVFVRRRLSDFGRRATRQDIDSFRVVAGFDGTVPEDFGPASGWFWDVNFNYGRTVGTQTNRGNLFLSALADSLGPSMVVDGVPTCVRIANDATTAIDGCVPLNLFGPIPQEQVAALTFAGVARGTNELTSFQLNTSGELFQLLSERPVGLAAGYEFRTLAGEFLFDPITEKGLVTGNKGQNTQGSYDVNELYAELSIPIVSAFPLAEDLEATAAIRWFDYSTFGSDYTYKFGGRWKPIRDVTIRGTYSTAFRAPSISELFQGPLDNFASLRDPCRGPSVASGPPGDPVDPSTTLGQTCIAQGVPVGGNGDDSSQLRSTNGGNQDLEPETADIYTVGVVFEPRWVKNLSVTLDYYNIDIDDNISTIGESVILQGCYSGANPAYCDLVQRQEGTGRIDTIVNLNANVGSLSTAGLDLSIKYALPTPTFGRFGFSFDGAWLQKIDQVLADGTLVKGRNTFDLNTLNSAGGSGGAFPEWKFNAGVTWGWRGLGAGVSTRYLSGFTECSDDTGDFSGAGLCYAEHTAERHVSSYHTEDVFLSYGFNNRFGKTNLMAGVLNVGNAPPARIYNGFLAQTDPYNYDVMGRFFYARLAQTF